MGQIPQPGRTQAEIMAQIYPRTTVLDLPLSRAWNIFKTVHGFSEPARFSSISPLAYCRCVEVRTIFWSGSSLVMKWSCLVRP